MHKEFAMKIFFLVMMVLLVSTIGTGVGSAEPLSPFRGADADSSAESQFAATVSGTNVDFDWSALVAANAYTMAVALSDINGDVDMSSLALLDMGTQKTFSTSALPSGMIFYATILAETAQGQVVSNTVKFMPFAGTVTFPATGLVLIQLDDPGGIGTITVSGIVNAAQETMTISQISGDAGFGPFVLTVVDDKPETYTAGDLTMHFTYAADGTVMVQSVRTEVRSADVDSDAYGWNLLNSCEQSVREEMDALAERFSAVYNQSRFIGAILTQLAKTALDKSYERHINSDEAKYYLKIYSKINGFIGIFRHAAIGLGEKYYEDIAKLREEFYACVDDTIPAPDPDPNPDNPVITIDTSCSIPPGAEYHERYYTDGSLNAQFYTLNGHNVGPYDAWSVKDDGSTYLSTQSCRNVDGQLIGWQIYYYMVNGNMMVAVPYENGVVNGHQYDYYEDGSLHIDHTMVNDIETYRLVYHEDGTLKMYCDCDGDGIWHWTK